MIDPGQQGQPPAGVQQPPVQLDTNPEPKLLHAIGLLADSAGSAESASDAHEFAQGAGSLAAALLALAKAGELHANVAAAQQSGGQGA